jgi:hypothetical protein
MDDRVKQLKTPEQCESFEKNALRGKRPDLAAEARQRSIQLRAENYGVTNQAERECLEAVFAYERVLSEKNGRATRASRTWPMIRRHGVLAAVERVVNRPDEAAGYTALREIGLEKYAFEAVVLRYPDLFSPEAVSRSQARANEWKRP